MWANPHFCMYPCIPHRFSTCRVNPSTPIRCMCTIRPLRSLQACLHRLLAYLECRWIRTSFSRLAFILQGALPRWNSILQGLGWLGSHSWAWIFQRAIIFGLSRSCKICNLVLGQYFVRGYQAWWWEVSETTLILTVVLGLDRFGSDSVVPVEIAMGRRSAF